MGNFMCAVDGNQQADGTSWTEFELFRRQEQGCRAVMFVVATQFCSLPIVQLEINRRGIVHTEPKA